LGYILFFIIFLISAGISWFILVFGAHPAISFGWSDLFFKRETPLCFQWRCFGKCDSSQKNYCKRSHFRIYQ